MTTTSKKEFLTKEIYSLLENLEEDTEPRFGLMTPQHMVEHLIWTIKTSVVRKGEPEAEPTKRQLGFRKFIENGALFAYRPSDKTKADLPDLRLASLQEAIDTLPEAINRFYTTFESNPGFKSYSPFMGEFGFEDLELFHLQHVRHHLYQFHLLEEYGLSPY